VAVGERWKPGLVDLLGVFLAVAVVLIGGQRLFGDSDPALHVATGNWILAHRQVPHTDPFSGTWVGKEWFAHEWLADVLWALVYRAAGWAGLVALSAALIALTYAILYRFLVRGGGHALAAFVATAAAASTAASHWLARPHLLTVLLLVIWTATIEAALSGRRGIRILAFLPLLMALWVNLHGGFLIGFVVLACYLAGALLQARDRARPLLVAGAGAALATLANPYGIRLPAHLLAYFARPRADLASNQEFAPATLADRAGLVLAVFLALCLLSLAWAWWVGWRRGIAPGISPGALLSFLATAILSLLSIRHAEIAGVFGAIVITRGLSSAFDRVLCPEDRLEWRRFSEREALRGGLLAGVAIAAIGGLALVGVPRNAGYDPARFPVEAVRALVREGVAPRGPVFSAAIWGGYLVLEWPRGKVYVDGRTDMYGDEFMERYAGVYLARAGWREELENAGVEWAILPRDAPLARSLERDGAWTLWRADDTALVFRR